MLAHALGARPLACSIFSLMTTLYVVLIFRKDKKMPQEASQPQMTQAWKCTQVPVSLWP